MAKINIKSVVYGRESEKTKLDLLCTSGRAEFVALYGRRRIGKTWLIERYVGAQSKIFVQVTGQLNGTKQRQLEIFQSQIEISLFNGERLSSFKNWNDALIIMTLRIKQITETLKQGEIISVFLDELPWLSTPKSGMLAALDHIWNTELRKISALKLIVCGSAASWMIKNIVDSKGGLHNRLTASIRLMPLTLSETKMYLEAKGIRWVEREVLALYMAIGGVPYYLDFAKPGRSATQIIGEICFGRGELRDELDRLFVSLFGSGGKHFQIIKAIGSKLSGCTRDEIADAIKLNSGGQLTQYLQELIEAGFVDAHHPLHNKTKDARYRLIDEFVWFALRWIEKSSRGALSPSDSVAYWAGRSTTAAYRTWSGYAFEFICLKHHDKIRAALGFAGVATEVGSWSYKPQSKADQGAQIDLVFERADRCYSICEIKYHDSEFAIDKKYAQVLQNKRDLFARTVAGNKQVFLTVICAHGFSHNEWSRGLVDSVIDGSALF